MGLVLGWPLWVVFLDDDDLVVDLSILCTPISYSPGVGVNRHAYKLIGQSDRC